MAAATCPRRPRTMRGALVPRSRMADMFSTMSTIWLETLRRSCPAPSHRRDDEPAASEAADGGVSITIHSHDDTDAQLSVWSGRRDDAREPWVTNQNNPNYMQLML